MQWRHLMPVVACLLAVAIPAIATTPLATPATQAPPDALAVQLTPQDRSFIDTFLTNGLAEVEMGELAGHRARLPAVRELARRFAGERKSANQRLAAMVAPLGLGPLPDEPSPDHKALALQLARAAPADFDRLYIDSQVREHEDQVELLEMEVSAGDHPELKKFAADVLPMAREHLQQARLLATELRAGRSPTPPPAAARAPAPGAS